jgi:predicted PurR-regulated permease PerM
MRIEIDFQSPQREGGVYRAFLIALPVLAVILVLWFWLGPILETLSPFALAFILAYLFNPIVDWIAGERRERFRIHRGLAILLLYLSVAWILFIAISTVLPAIFRESSQFARKVRKDYLPALSERVQPVFEEWFSPQILVKNGRFTEWEKDHPTNWDLSSGTVIHPLLEESGGARIQSAAGGSWALRQSISSLVGDETYTLMTRTQGSHDTGRTWSVRLAVWAATPEIEASSPLHQWQLSITSKGLLRMDVYVPEGVFWGHLEILPPAGGGEASLLLQGARLQKPPPLPFLDPHYWVNLYHAKRDEFTWSNLATVLGYSLRGAGLVAGGAGGVWVWAYRRVGGVVSIVIYLTFLLVIVFYMLLDFTAFKKSCVELVPAKWRNRFLEVASELDRQLGGFIRGQLIVCLCVGGLVSFFLILLRVPFAPLIGMLAGLFNFVPYLGPAMGLGPAVVLTLLEFFDPGSTTNWVLTKLFLVVGSFGLVQSIDGFFISPKIMARTVDVEPLVVIGALMLGGGIGGVTGMVLAIPGYCVLRVLVGQYRKEVAKTRAKSLP